MLSSSELSLMFENTPGTSGNPSAPVGTSVIITEPNGVGAIGDKGVFEPCAAGVSSPAVVPSTVPPDNGVAIGVLPGNVGGLVGGNVAACVGGVHVISQSPPQSTLQLFFARIYYYFFFLKKEKTITHPCSGPF